MKIGVWDEDVISPDHVGTSVLKLSSLCVGKGVDEWFEAQYKGKSCGSIHLRSHWNPDEAEADQ